MTPRGPRGPYAGAADRAQRLLPLLRRLRAAGIVTPRAIAQELARRNIPPPGRVPWCDMGAARLLRTAATLEARRKAQREARRQLRVVRRGLRDAITAWSLGQYRLRLLGERRVWHGVVERQAAGIARRLARYPELRAEAGEHLSATLPDALDGVVWECREQRGEVRLAEILEGVTAA